MIIRLIGPEISVATANAVSNATLVRVINTGASATMNVAYSNGTVYANLTVTNTESVILQKSATDTIIGANMKAAPIAYRY
jgi:hypothetical protein